MKTAFGSDSRGCSYCVNDLPATETTILLDGAQIRTRQCGLCGEIWQYQKLTREQAIILDVRAGVAKMLADLAATFGPATGDRDPAADYEAVMEEIGLRYGTDAVDHLKAVLAVVEREVRAGHDAAAASEPTYKVP